jgi:hypothetical protein
MEVGGNGSGETANIASLRAVGDWVAKLEGGTRSRAQEHGLARAAIRG